MFTLHNPTIPTCCYLASPSRGSRLSFQNPIFFLNPLFPSVSFPPPKHTSSYILIFFLFPKLSISLSLSNLLSFYLNLFLSLYSVVLALHDVPEAPKLLQIVFRESRRLQQILKTRSTRATQGLQDQC